MASIQKYGRTTLGRLFLHNNRVKDDGVTHMGDIDNERTSDNYHFVRNDPKYVMERLKSFYYTDRHDLVVLAESVITLPSDVKPSDEKKFFEACYEFFCEDFGKENVVNAVVHKDEYTPHMHLDFLPVKPIKEEELTEVLKKRIENYEKTNGVKCKGRLCSKEVLNRQYFQNFHPRLSVYIENALGYETEILNGATQSGNRTVLQLKNESLQRELEVKKSQVAEYSAQINFLSEQIRKTGFDMKYFSYPEVFARLDGLQKENLSLRLLLKDNGIEVPREVFDSMTQVSFINKDKHFYVTTGDYPARSEAMKALEAYDPNVKSVRVIETYKDVPRIMPEWEFIESDEELELVINSNPKKITEFKDFVIFPTDDITDTVEGLIWLKKHESKFVKIEFPQISNDEFNIAEGILRQCLFDTEYRLKQAEKEQNNVRIKE